MSLLSNKPRLNRRESSQYLREKHGIVRSPATLAKQASTGEGPDYQFDGRMALSTPEMLDEYAARVLGPTVRNASDLRLAREDRGDNWRQVAEPLTPIPESAEVNLRRNDD